MRKQRIIITQQLIETVEKLAAFGLSVDKISDFIGVGQKTFYNWRQKNEDLRVALQRGQAKGVAKAGAKLLVAIENGEPWAIKFYLKSKGGFSEHMSIDHTSSDGSMSPAVNYEQIKQASAEALAELKKMREDKAKKKAQNIRAVENDMSF